MHNADRLSVAPAMAIFNILDKMQIQHSIFYKEQS